MASQTTELPNWMRNAIVTLTIGAALAGMSGLVIAGTTVAKVDANAAKLEDVDDNSKAIARIETKVDGLSDRIDRERIEQQDRDRELNRKLDRLLQQPNGGTP